MIHALQVLYTPQMEHILRIRGHFHFLGYFKTYNVLETGADSSSHVKGVRKVPAQLGPLGGSSLDYWTSSLQNSVSHSLASGRKDFQFPKHCAI
jgi:hypothetical protein